MVPPDTAPKTIADKTSPANFLPLFIFLSSSISTFLWKLLSLRRSVFFLLTSVIVGGKYVLKMVKA